MGNINQKIPKEILNEAVICAGKYLKDILESLSLTGNKIIWIKLVYSETVDLGYCCYEDLNRYNKHLIHYLIFQRCGQNKDCVYKTTDSMYSSQQKELLEVCHFGSCSTITFYYLLKNSQLMQYAKSLVPEGYNVFIENEKDEYNLVIGKDLKKIN